MKPQSDNNNNEGLRTNTVVASASGALCRCNNDALGMGMKAVDAKATRRIAAQWGLHASQLETLSIVWCWMELNGRQEAGGQEASIVHWSGARALWKKRIHTGVRECIDQGVIERFAFSSGTRIRITAKGYQILRAWRDKTEELIATWLQEGKVL